MNRSVPNVKAIAAVTVGSSFSFNSTRCVEMSCKASSTRSKEASVVAVSVSILLFSWPSSDRLSLHRSGSSQ